MGREIDPEIKSAIKLAYCLQRKSVAEIIGLFSVSDSTLRRWIDQHGWKDLRGKRVMSGPFLAERYRDHMNKILEQAEEEGRGIDNGETDRLYKISIIIDKLENRSRFEAHAIETMDLFNTFMVDREPALAGQLTQHIVAFTEWLVKFHGSGS